MRQKSRTLNLQGFKKTVIIDLLVDDRPGKESTAAGKAGQHNLEFAFFAVLAEQLLKALQGDSRSAEADESKTRKHRADQLKGDHLCTTYAKGAKEGCASFT